MTGIERMIEPSDDDPRFRAKRPKAYGEKTVEDILADFEKRLARLESQAGTS